MNMIKFNYLRENNIPIVHWCGVCCLEVSKNRGNLFTNISFYCTPQFWDRQRRWFLSNKWMWHVIKVFWGQIRVKWRQREAKNAPIIQTKFVASKRSHVPINITYINSSEMDKSWLSSCVHQLTTPTHHSQCVFIKQFFTVYEKSYHVKRFNESEKNLENKFANHYANNVWFFFSIKCSARKKAWKVVLRSISPAPFTKFLHKFILIFKLSANICRE